MENTTVDTSASTFAEDENPDTAEAAASTRTVIGPDSGWRFINFKEIWRYRGLLYFLTWRDIKVRYKQTVLGVLWAIIKPFTSMVIFSVVFGQLAQMDSEGYPYPIYLYAGMLPWQFFRDALSRSSTSVVQGANLVTKVYFPRLIIPLSSVGAGLVDFAISFSILVGLMFYYQVMPAAPTLMVIPLVLATIFTALGVGTLLSALNVAYRDFRYMIPFLLKTWMFLTPVVYAVKIVPEGYRWLLFLNPMSGIVDGYRSAILGKPFDWPNLAISTCIAVLGFVVGMVYFRRIEREFADII